MLFHFLNFSQCVVCMFGHKKIYKVTNLKVHSKGRYFLFFLKNKSRLWKFEWLAGGENAWLRTAFQNRNPVRVFLYHGISDGNRLFSENLGCHFHFILHVMSDIAAFVRGALLCVQRYRGNLGLSHSNSASCWQRINLHICRHRVSVGNTGPWYK